jgi:hypothetical protein
VGSGEQHARGQIKKAIRGSHPLPCFINIVTKAIFPQSPTITHISPQHYTPDFSGIKRQELKKKKNFSASELFRIFSK